MRAVFTLALATLCAAAAFPQGAGPINRPRPRPTAKPTAPLLYYDGFLVSMESHQVEIETLSQRRIVCRLNEETEYTTYPSEFAPGDRIGVSTASSREDQCVAAWIGRPEERFQERRKAPRISRGPGGKLKAEDAPLNREDPFILRAVEANLAFSDELPDFTCHQVTTRAASRNLGKKWKDRDVIEADVVVYKGEDEYTNITIDGVPTQAKMEQVGFIWSTGEYSAVLHNLFHDYSRAQFERSGEPETIRGHTGVPYKFHVDGERSNWLLNINNQKLKPEYTGRVWLDEETGRALRVELEAVNLPWEYPLITAESMVEYDTVAIGDKSYLLPVESMNMGCRRGSASCFRTRLEFRDYRKFTSESTLYQTDSDVTFGEEVEPEQESGPEQ